MRVLDFTLGTNPKTGEEQWKVKEVVGRLTTIYLVDYQSPMRPEIGRTRYTVIVGDSAHVSEDGNFRLVPVILKTALPQVRSDEECVEKEDEEVEETTPRRVVRVTPPAPRQKGRKARRYVPLGPDGKRVKLPGRPRSRKLGKKDNKAGKK